MSGWRKETGSSTDGPWPKIPYDCTTCTRRNWKNVHLFEYAPAPLRFEINLFHHLSTLALLAYCKSHVWAARLQFAKHLKITSDFRSRIRHKSHVILLTFPPFCSPAPHIWPYTIATSQTVVAISTRFTDLRTHLKLCHYWSIYPSL